MTETRYKFDKVGSKFDQNLGSKRCQNLGAKKCPEMDQKKWPKRGQNLVQTGSNFNTKTGRQVEATKRTRCIEFFL